MKRKEPAKSDFSIVENHIKREAWQVVAIKKGVAAAERGEFASDEEVAKRFTKRGVKVTR